MGFMGGLIGGALNVTSPIGALAGGLLGSGVEDIAGGSDTGTLERLDMGAAGSRSQSELRSQANMSPDELARKQLEGTQGGQNAFSTKERLEQQATATGQNPDMLKAIQERQKQVYGQDLASLQQKVQLAAPTQAFDRSQLAFNANAVDAQMEAEYQGQLAQVQLDRLNMRNQIIGGVIGGVGKIGGAIAGGGG